jgi:CobQ-like glutamine amidotransferase family enzyme
MNIYGDRGNMLCLERRCRQRGLGFQVQELGLGDKLKPKECDLIFVGGAQDREQRRVAEDLLRRKGKALLEAVNRGVALLAVCGGYQLMGRFYRTGEGEELPGIGVFDMWTEHPGASAQRFIGNVVAEREGETLVGFENHGGRTYLSEGSEPLARIVVGHGNNGRDGGEGAVNNNAFGTYLHGSLLPKNPVFADMLIEKALRRRYRDVTLGDLDDRLERTAHAAAVRLATGRSMIT